MGWYETNAYQSWANRVMKYYMNEGTIVSQSTALDAYMVKRASLPHIQPLRWNNSLIHS
jgi:hypothetical protein